MTSPIWANTFLLKAIAKITETKIIFNITMNSAIFLFYDSRLLYEVKTMNSEIEKKYQRLRSFFFGLCILAAGLLFLITTKNIIKTLSAENWRVYSGVLETGKKTRTSFFLPNQLDGIHL